MKLFGNNVQSKYGKNPVRTPAAAQEPRPTAAQERPAQTAQQTPSRKAGQYTKDTDIFAYANLPEQERRARMQEDYRNTPVKLRKKSKHKKRVRAFTTVLVIALVLIAMLASMLLVFTYSQSSFVRKWRDIYIQTAMSTMSHQWLATAIFPKEVIDECLARRDAMMQGQINVNSTDEPTLDTKEYTEPPAETEDAEEAARNRFYEVFWELDRDETEAYFAQYPDAVKDGYDHINLNEAGLRDDGLDLYTTMGEQVLAIDAENEVLLLRIYLDGSRGVLAVAKDPSLLHLYPSQGIGAYGQHAGTIAQNNNGLLAMTGSGFIDEGGNGNGGTLAGYAKCDGVEYGYHRGWGIKRIELKDNDRLYINDAPNDCGSNVTDAVEFEPALVVNGKQLPVSDYTALNPRACIGQSKTGEILMVVVEGRFVDSPGCSVEYVAEKMIEHNCQTAMNLDGGTSAIMWYDGEVVTRCSNTRTPEGRYLPNAWVYTYKD